jgi:hypothetical protein
MSGTLFLREDQVDDFIEELVLQVDQDLFPFSKLYMGEEIEESVREVIDRWINPLQDSDLILTG